MASDAHFLHYWGKTGKEDPQSCHLLPFHCLDVAAVGMVCLEDRLFGTPPATGHPGFDASGLRAWAGFLLALHDLGKFSFTFQAKAPKALAALGRVLPKPRFSEHHGLLGNMFWEKVARPGPGTTLAHAVFAGADWQDRDVLARAVFGHHGVPPDMSRQASCNIRDFFTAEDREAATVFIAGLHDLFGLAEHPWPKVDGSFYSRLSWWLAGLAVLCDWIGSNQDCFALMRAPLDLTTYYQSHALPQARLAVTRSGIAAPGPAPWTGFQGLFPAIGHPSPLQAHISGMELPHGPQLHILEDVTGSGKTEAALALAHRLMAAGCGQGLYVGLPTMATASAMYGRMHTSYRRLFVPGPPPSLILAHAARDFDHSFTASVQQPEWSGIHIRAESASAGLPQEEDAAVCAAWLADNRKKSLLAAVGVGTLDQALLGVLPLRHQSLRLLGLSRCVLIADEVHAYDAYTTKLLEALLRFMGSMGSSAILLSATLPARIKTALARAFASGLEAHVENLDSQAYPLATSVDKHGSVLQHPLRARPDVSRWTAVSRLPSPAEAHKAIVQASKAGACVLYVRNTVDDALETFRELSALLPGQVDLFHARFCLEDRQRIEARVLDLFGTDSTPEKRRGRVLVATQVAEQSLDVDFDLVVSDLAAIESLVQRAGRGCRHPGRERPEGYASARLLAVSPDPEAPVGADWYSAMFPRAAFVYPGHGRLWLAARRLFGAGGFDLSREGRELMEYVYGQERPDVPEALLASDEAYEGCKLADASWAVSKLLQVREGYRLLGESWDRSDDVATRLGRSTVRLCLCRMEDGVPRPWATDPVLGAAWRLSEVQTAKSRFARTTMAPKQADAVRETMPGKGHWVEPVLLEPVAGRPGFWRGKGEDASGSETAFLYSHACGLEWETARH